MAAQQPDSLKLSATLCVLRHLHKVAEGIEAEYGDKSAEGAFFHCGVQGKVTRHSADRDYDYFLARAAEVRAHLEDNLVHNQGGGSDSTLGRVRGCPSASKVVDAGGPSSFVRNWVL